MEQSEIPLIIKRTKLPSHVNYYLDCFYPERHMLVVNNHLSKEEIEEAAHSAMLHFININTFHVDPTALDKIHQLVNEL